MISHSLLKLLSKIILIFLDKKIAYCLSIYFYCSIESEYYCLMDLREKNNVFTSLCGSDVLYLIKRKNVCFQTLLYWM